DQSRPVLRFDKVNLLAGELHGGSADLCFKKPSGLRGDLGRWGGNSDIGGDDVLRYLALAVFAANRITPPAIWQGIAIGFKMRAETLWIELDEILTPE